MKKRICILIIILILIFVIFKFYKSKNNIFNDSLIFNLWSDIGDKNEYIIKPKKEEKVRIDVFQTQNKMYKKIAPGSSGKFTIRIIKPTDSNCEISIKESSNKPENLIFILDGKEYITIKEMQEKLNKIFKEKNKAIINWKWKYEQSEEKDIEDTNDGEKAQKYIFEINAIIE